MSVFNVRLAFSIGDVRVCHTVHIIDDVVCEDNPNESFFSSLDVGSREQAIIVEPSLTEVIIDNTNQPECGE